MAKNTKAERGIVNHFSLAKLIVSSAKKHWLTILLAVLLLWSIFSQHFLLSPFHRAKAEAARWPWLHSPHLNLAQALFLTGSSGWQQELEYGKKKFLSNIIDPGEVIRQISYWQSFETQDQDSPIAALKLSLLNFMIYEDDKAASYWEKAFYLDPNSKITDEVKQIINQ